MKKEFYLLPLLLFLFSRLAGQDCSTLQVTYTANESRCVATGSIILNATGGSGNYNYKATGPVTTPLTSSNVITGLLPGYYSVLVKDLTTGCTKQQDSVFVPGTYDDPRFQLVKTDASCAGNDGTVSVLAQQFGRSPFTYTIINPSPSGVGTSNVSGSFSGLVAGEYAIQLQDSCGGIQVRRITIENYSWWFDAVNVTRIGCDSGNVFIGLRDNKGNINTSGTAFNGFMYAVVITPGDTTWKTANSFTFFLGSNRKANIVVKDNCGVIKVSTWYMPDNVKPAVGAVSTGSFTCSTFTATLGGQQNLTNPNFCLYDSVNTLIACNTTGVFANIAYGSYCIQVTNQCYDTSFSRCFIATQPVPSVGASVLFSNAACSTFTASVTGQTNLINPQYCLINSFGDTTKCNFSGVFTSLPYDSYCIIIKNGCADTVIERCFTYTRPVPAITGYSLNGSTCSTFNVNTWGTNLNNPRYCLYDSSGNVVACDSTGTFTGIPHGTYCIKAISCGDTTAALCFTSTKPIPSVASWVQISNAICTGFTATITGQTNLTSPQYCLYNSVDSLITCNTTGVFTNIPYGTYCINIKDSCTDSTIRRCFTQLQAVPSVNATMQLTNLTCTTLSARVVGTNLTAPQYCLTDTLGNVITCNTTGIFDNILYGRYCVTVRDGCIDTTITICQTFTSPQGISLTTSKSCTIGMTNISTQFANGNGPFRVRIYHANGSLIKDTTSSANPVQLLMPGLAAGSQYKIVGTDGCGKTDSSLITPDATVVTKSITARSKCPSASWANGAGDLLATTTSNFYATIPAVIKKNGVAFNRSYSSVSGGTYTFADLEPASYIVEYTMQTCNTKLYDTISIQPYAYPTQAQSAIYECDNNTLSLGADVQGGVSPYTFQIIGSSPAMPSIITAPQNSAVFSINTGTRYSLVRLRAIDACGNATLDDVSILPLQNIAITANQNCFYQNTVLSVNAIPNATYKWYKKRTATDSVLLGTDTSYTLPFFVPEEAGEYLCKVDVNNGCLVRLSSYTLDGNCGNVILPVSVQLKGKQSNGENMLTWITTDEQSVATYSIERKQSQGREFMPVGNIKSRNSSTGSSYTFTDRQPAAGSNAYRLKIIYQNGKTGYSNTVDLLSAFNNTRVYPNPVKSELYISLSEKKPADFTIELFDLAGRNIYHAEKRNVLTTVITYHREKNIQPGIYMLKVTNTNSGEAQVHKILFE